MSKLKNILMIVLGAISALFYILLKSKNEKIAQQKSELEKITRDKDALKEVIKGAEQDAKKLQNIKKDIRSKPISSVVDELRERGEYKD